MEPLNRDVETVLTSIEDVTWLSIGQMFFSSLGVYGSSDIRNELGIDLKDDHVTVSFIISTHKTYFALESAMILNAITKLGYRYRTTNYSIFGDDYIQKHFNNYAVARNTTEQLNRYCPYQPLTFKLDDTTGSLETITVSTYCNDWNTFNLIKQTDIKRIYVDVHKDAIRDFLINLNNYDVGKFVQCIIYTGTTNVENDNISYFLTGYQYDGRITLNELRPSTDKTTCLARLKLKVTKVLVNAISKKNDMPTDEVLTYLLDKQHSLLDTNFIKINFRLKNPTNSTWSFLFNSLDSGNVVPSMINWENDLPQGGVVYCPLPYFKIFMNKLKLFNNDYLNLTYYPYFHK